MISDLSFVVKDHLAPPFGGVLFRGPRGVLPGEGARPCPGRTGAVRAGAALAEGPCVTPGSSTFMSERGERPCPGQALRSRSRSVRHAGTVSLIHLGSGKCAPGREPSPQGGPRKAGMGRLGRERRYSRITVSSASGDPRPAARGMLAVMLAFTPSIEHRVLSRRPLSSAARPPGAPSLARSSIHCVFGILIGSAARDVTQGIGLFRLGRWDERDVTSPALRVTARDHLTAQGRCRRFCSCRP